MSRLFLDIGSYVFCEVHHDVTNLGVEIPPFIIVLPTKKVIFHFPVTLPEGNMLVQQCFCAVVEITWLGHRPSCSCICSLDGSPSRSTKCFPHNEVPTYGVIARWVANGVIACYIPSVGCTRLPLRGFMIINILSIEMLVQSWTLNIQCAPT